MIESSALATQPTVATARGLVTAESHARDRYVSSGENNSGFLSVSEASKTSLCLGCPLQSHMGPQEL